MALVRHFGNLGKDLYDIMMALMEDQDLMKFPKCLTKAI